jgi:hypothetical protein
MEQANTNSKAASLPLFRAEALAARQQGTHGEILLIRPLSLVLLGWLGVAVAASAIGFLVLGEYTPRQSLEGTITGTAAMRGGNMAAEVIVANAAMPALRPGQELRVRCTSCENALTGKIIRISPVPPSSIEAANPSSTVTIELPENTELTVGTKVQAEVQLEKKPLIVWLLSKPRTSPRPPGSFEACCARN